MISIPFFFSELISKIELKLKAIEKKDAEIFFEIDWLIGRTYHHIS